MSNRLYGENSPIRLNLDDKVLVSWFHSALELTKEMISHFYDPQASFFDTRDDQAPLLYRPKNLQDNVTLSGGSFADVSSCSLDYGYWLCAIYFAFSPLCKVATLGDLTHPTTASFQQCLWSAFCPFHLAAIVNPPAPPGSPPLLEYCTLLNGLPTAYVCKN